MHKLFISSILKPKTIRIVEKTTRNCLRIPFLNTIFPDAFFIFLTRDPRSNISSLIEGWRGARKFQAYRLPGGIEIEGYVGSAWNFLLPPGWDKYAKGRRLEQVCAFQYRTANQNALESLSKIPENRWMILRYEDLITYPKEKVNEICEKMDLSYTGGLKRMAEEMPVVNTPVQPNSNKWKKNESQVMSIIETVRDISERMGYTL